jgi:hypothetical protein
LKKEKKNDKSFFCLCGRGSTWSFFLLSKPHVNMLCRPCEALYLVFFFKVACPQKELETC